MWLYSILTDLNRFSVWLADVGEFFEYLELKHTRERKKEKERKTETEGLKDDSMEKKRKSQKQRESETKGIKYRRCSLLYPHIDHVGRLVVLWSESSQTYEDFQPTI